MMLGMGVKKMYEKMVNRAIKLKAVLNRYMEMTGVMINTLNEFLDVRKICIFPLVLFGVQIPQK